MYFKLIFKRKLRHLQTAATGCVKLNEVDFFSKKVILNIPIKYITITCIWMQHTAILTAVKNGFPVEKKRKIFFSNFYFKYIVGARYDRLVEAVLTSTHNLCSRAK